MDPEELRLECVTLAVEAGACPECVLDLAREIEAYVRGDAALFTAFGH